MAALPEHVESIHPAYGGDRAAIAAAVSTYRPRGALRESGKALGVDPLILEVAKSHRWFDHSSDLLQRFSATEFRSSSVTNRHRDQPYAFACRC